MNKIEITTIKHLYFRSLTEAFIRNYRTKDVLYPESIIVNFKLNMPVCLFLELLAYHPKGWAMGNNSNKYDTLSFYEPSVWKDSQTDDVELTNSGTTIKAAANSLGKTLDILGKSSVEILEQSNVLEQNLSSLLPMSVYREFVFSVTIKDLLTLLEVISEMSFGLQEYVNGFLDTFDRYCLKGNRFELSREGYWITSTFLNTDEINRPTSNT